MDESHIGIAAELWNSHLQRPSLRPCDDAADEVALYAVPRPSVSLLLVEGGAPTRVRLQRALTTTGFTVTDVGGLQAAFAIAAETAFAYAVVELRHGDGNGLDLVRMLRE